MEATQCGACHSVNVARFTGEIAIHFPGLKNIDKSPVFAFPELLVCLDCGVAQFVIPEEELGQLKQAASE